MIKKHIMTIIGYVIATFATQGTSHFVIFQSHYAQQTIMRAQPIVAFGLLTMIIQGVILSMSYANSRLNDASLSSALKHSFTFGLVISSYIALAEAGKYKITNMGEWIAVEFGVAAVQFVLAGICLNVAHNKFCESSS